MRHQSRDPRAIRKQQAAEIQLLSSSRDATANTKNGVKELLHSVTEVPDGVVRVENELKAIPFWKMGQFGAALEKLRHAVKPSAQAKMSRHASANAVHSHVHNNGA